MACLMPTNTLRRQGELRGVPAAKLNERTLVRSVCRPNSSFPVIDKPIVFFWVSGDSGPRSVMVSPYARFRAMNPRIPSIIC